MNLRHHRRSRHPMMAWQIKRPRWFRGAPPRRPPGPTRPTYAFALHPDGTSTDLSQSLEKRIERNRRRRAVPESLKAKRDQFLYGTGFLKRWKGKRGRVHERRIPPWNVRIKLGPVSNAV